MTARRKRPQDCSNWMKYRSGRPRDARRFAVHLSLTDQEIHRLKAAAAADLRSIGNYVSKIIVDALRLKAQQWPAP